MKISFIVNPVFDGWSPASIRVGGSEECVIEWAKRLAKDHEVTVYHNGLHGDYEGVNYKDHSEYQAEDVTINVNYPEFPVQGSTIFYTSLSENPDLSQFDAVACLSEYARTHTHLPERAVIIPPGYDETQIYADKKVAKQCFYASSPDRGLSVLLDAWDKVYAVHPDATLLVTYGGNIDLPGVINLGETDEKTMNDIYRTSDIWCHPCTGVELYCMTGKKAQAAGCIPVIVPAMALAETVERGFKTDIEHYAASLTEVLSMPMEGRDMIRRDIIRHANATTWEESTAQLLGLINSVVS